MDQLGMMPGGQKYVGHDGATSESQMHVYCWLPMRPQLHRQQKIIQFTDRVTLYSSGVDLGAASLGLHHCHSTTTVQQC